MAPALNPAVTDGLLHDTSSLVAGSDLAIAIAEFTTEARGPFGDAVGSFAVHSSRVEELRPLTDPEGHLPLAVVADDGLLALQEAREALQDDVWVSLDHLRIAIPDGFAPDVATRALLDELAFTVPTFVELPRTGYETALDVLAADGAERAAWGLRALESEGDLPADGELAAFVHGCVTRRVPFLLPAGVDAAVRTPGSHGVLNVLAATSAAADGATTSEVADVIASHDELALVAGIDRVTPGVLRDLFQGVGVTDVSSLLDALAELGVLSRAD